MGLITSEHNPDKYTDCKNLVKNFEKYKDIIKNQIEQINPDIIVAFGKCDNKGLMELLTELFDLSLEDKNVGETFININNKEKKLLFSYHPSHFGETDEKFIQVLEERWNNL